MQPPVLYDLSPLVQLMLQGLALAALPLGWLALRHRKTSAAGRLRALTVLTLFLTFDLVLFGAFTRLSDSGLGCPDWPGCYGHASPLGAQADIAQAQAAMPTGPVTHRKAWIEMIHRYLATTVGVLIVVLTAATAWLRRRATLPVGLGWPLATLLWVCVQGAFGALTVTLKLQPLIVTGHLLGGLALLALLCKQTVIYAQAGRGRGRHLVAPRERWILVAVAAFVWAQVALGGWVSTNYAVLACNEFPRCQGQWWPPMDLRQGFELWRELGKTGDGEHVSFAALTGIHYMHRLMAYVVLVLLAGAAWQLWRGPLARQARWLAGLAAWQLATGLSNVVLGWPLAAALGHTGGAAVLVAVLAWALADSRSARTTAQAAAQHTAAIDLRALAASKPSLPAAAASTHAAWSAAERPSA